MKKSEYCSATERGNIMGIDPSINSCGIAIFGCDEFEYAKLVKPFGKSDLYYEKSFSVYNQICVLASEYDVKHIVLEIPEYWAVAGFMARESGSLFKLNWVCGMIYTMTATIPMTLVAPREWKGQLSKQVCKNRLWKHYKKIIDIDEWECLDHNVVDAIGLCHYKIHGRV